MAKKQTPLEKIKKLMEKLSAIHEKEEDIFDCGGLAFGPELMSKGSPLTQSQRRESNLKPHRLNLSCPR